MNYITSIANGAATVASAAYNGTCSAAKYYTKAAETAYTVASSAIEVGNDIQNGITYAICNPWQCFKTAAYNVSGMNNFSEAGSTMWRQPNQNQARSLLTRVGDAASQIGIGASKLVTGTMSTAGGAFLYATNKGFNSVVNATASTLGSAALTGIQYAVAGTVQVLQVAGTASLEAANALRNSPQEAIQSAADKTTIVAGAVGALGMAYLSGKALIGAEAERTEGAGWGSRFKMGTYLLASAASAVAAATLAAVSYQTYTK